MLVGALVSDKVTKVREHEPTTNTIRKSPLPDEVSREAFDLTLPGVLWAAESTGIKADSIPDGGKARLLVNLRDYQKQSVAFMKVTPSFGFPHFNTCQ